MATANQSGIDPASAHTAEDFVQLLREVRTRSQLTYWEIEERAREYGYDLEPAVVVHALGQPTLPDWQLVVGLLAACGYQGMMIDRWMRVYHELFAIQPVDELLPEDYEEPEEEPAPAHTGRGRRRATGAGWTRRHTAYAVTVALLAVLALFLVGPWNSSPNEFADGQQPTLAPDASPTQDATLLETPSPDPSAPPSGDAVPSTAPAGVLRSGTATLADGQGIDLDTGQSSGGLDVVAASGTALEAADNTKRLLLVSSSPSHQTCQSSPPGRLDREVTSLATGQWLCARTSAGRWARLNITGVGSSVKLSYVVWS